MHRQGLSQRAKARRRARASEIASRTGGYLERTKDTVTQGAGQGTSSIVGIAVAVLGVIALFLLLNRTSLASGVINGVLRSATWLVSPSVLPF